jgi:hypothetical protein
MIRSKPVQEKPVRTEKLVKMGKERPSQEFAGWLKRRWSLEFADDYFPKVAGLPPKEMMEKSSAFFKEKRIISTKVAAKSAFDEMGIKNLERRRVLSNTLIEALDAKKQPERQMLFGKILELLGGEREFKEFWGLFEDNLERLAVQQQSKKSPR